MKYRFNLSPSMISPFSDYANNNVGIIHYLTSLLGECVPRDMYFNFDYDRGNSSYVYLNISDDAFAKEFMLFLKHTQYNHIIQPALSMTQPFSMPYVQRVATEESISRYEKYFKPIVIGEGIFSNGEKMFSDENKSDNRSYEFHLMWLTFVTKYVDYRSCGKWQIFFDSHIYKIYFYTKLQLMCLLDVFKCDRIVCAKTDINLYYTKEYNKDLICIYTNGRDIDDTDETSEMSIDNKDFQELMKLVTIDFNELRIKKILYRPGRCTDLADVKYKTKERNPSVKKKDDKDIINLINNARELLGDDNVIDALVDDDNLSIVETLRQGYGLLRHAFVGSMNDKYEYKREISFYDDYCDIDEGYYDMTGGRLKNKVIWFLIIFVIVVIVVVIIEKSEVIIPYISGGMARNQSLL